MVMVKDNNDISLGIPELFKFIRRFKHIDSKADKLKFATSQRVVLEQMNWLLKTWIC